MAETASGSHYVVEGWLRGSNVLWQSTPQRRTVLRAVERAIVDEGAAIVHVTYYPGPARSTSGRGREVAQVTSALVWRWSSAADAGRLRAYVEAAAER